MVGEGSLAVGGGSGRRWEVGNDRGWRRRRMRRVRRDQHTAVAAPVVELVLVVVVADKGDFRDAAAGPGAHGGCVAHGVAAAAAGHGHVGAAAPAAAAVVVVGEVAAEHVDHD